MVSITDIILEYVCPTAGVITANIMFFSPVQDVRKAVLETGTLGDLNPTPWAFMLGNCSGWLVYSMLIDNLFVFFGNAPAFLLSLWLNMTAIKLYYENHQSIQRTKSIRKAIQDESSRRLDLIHDEPSEKLEEERQEEVTPVATVRETLRQDHHHHGLIDYAHDIWDISSQHKPAPAPQERLVMVMAIVWLGLISIVALGKDVLNQGTRELIVGIAVNLNLVFFYGAPLSSIATVLRTRSSSSIHVPTMITNTFNGAFWCAYGITLLDYFIAVPNGIGALLGGTQVLLCIMFPRKTSQTQQQQDEDNKEREKHTKSQEQKLSLTKGEETTELDHGMPEVAPDP